MLLNSLMYSSSSSDVSLLFGHDGMVAASPEREKKKQKQRRAERSGVSSGESERAGGDERPGRPGYDLVPTRCDRRAALTAPRAPLAVRRAARLASGPLTSESLLKRSKPSFSQPDSF